MPISGLRSFRYADGADGALGYVERSPPAKAGVRRVISTSPFGRRRRRRITRGISVASCRRMARLLRLVTQHSRSMREKPKPMNRPLILFAMSPPSCVPWAHSLRTSNLYSCSKVLHFATYLFWSWISGGVEQGVGPGFNKVKNRALPRACLKTPF